MIGFTRRSAVLGLMYVTDVATVQIYCAWAEVVLGETAFDKVLSTN